jgi:hypothetical protein
MRALVCHAGRMVAKRSAEEFIVGGVWRLTPDDPA